MAGFCFTALFGLKLIKQGLSKDSSVVEPFKFIYIPHIDNITRITNVSRDGHLCRR